jgi:ABC-type uncharacterized transport system permease subunit
MELLTNFFGYLVITFIWSAIISGMLSYLICEYASSLLGSHWINLEEDKTWEKAYFKCCKKIIITCFIFVFAFLSFFMLYK